MLSQAVRVDSAANHRRASLLADKWMRNGYATMKPEERIRALALVSGYSARRSDREAWLAGAATPPNADDARAEAMAELHGSGA